jgi:hypothetical protein
MRVLYHYTGIQSAISILSGSSEPSLRFYDILGMADEMEYRLGASHLMHELKNNVQIPLCRQLISIYDNLPDKQFERVFFSASCSLNGCNQFLWDNYAREGVCLEITEDYDKSVKNDVDIYDVYYSDGEPSSSLIIKLASLEETLSNISFFNTAKKCPRELEKLALKVLNSAAYEKHVSYWQEEERRILVNVKASEIEVDDRKRRYVLIPISRFGTVTAITYAPVTKAKDDWAALERAAADLGISVKERSSSLLFPSKTELDNARELSAGILKHVPFEVMSKIEQLNPLQLSIVAAGYPAESVLSTRSSGLSG